MSNGERLAVIEHRMEPSRRMRLAALFLLGGVGALCAAPATPAFGRTSHQPGGQPSYQQATPTPLLRPGGRFEEEDPRLRYTGTWSSVAHERASGGAVRRSSQRGAAVELVFPGAGVKWVTTRGPDRGVAQIFIDGDFRRTVDLYAAQEQFQTYVISFLSLAPDQTHTIRIVVAGERREESSGANVDVDAFIVDAAEEPPTLRFEDTDPAVQYTFFSDTWRSVAVNRASGGTVHRSKDAGASAQFTFRGNSILWVTSRGPDRGIAQVVIDHRPQDPIDLYRSTESFQETFYFDQLSGDTHTIRIEVTGNRSGAATDSVVDVDAFVVSGAPATPAPTPAVAPTVTRTPIPTATAVRPQPSPTSTPVVSAAPAAPAAVRDARYFSQTSFRIDHEPFWLYFESRGGVGTFGYPVSRTATFLGCTTQFFQRHVLQQCAGTGVRPLNLLDPDLMAATTINGSTFPLHDPALASTAPAPATPEYSQTVLDHLLTTVPSTFEGLPVEFFGTYMETVPPELVVSGPLVLRNLEMWGFPTSAPAFDPSNRGFVYQRFQRGIMHYRTSTRSTEAILLGDYFKSVLTGRGVPPDLASQMAGSPYLAQYCPGQPQWLCRPAQVQGTDLSAAFEPQ